jgi:Tfp pilus assembly protein PilN
VTVGELTQRLRRVDFLDGVGIYIGPHEVALAHIAKRFFRVRLRSGRIFPLPPTSRPAERRQALAQAVVGFAGEHRVDMRRAILCVPRSEAVFNRVLLPSAARENLAQVLEYEIEHLVPLPRDQVFFDYSVRTLADERIEVLLMCIPREVVRGYLEPLEEAFVRPRGIVLASTAIADYLAFCRGEAPGPIGLVLAAREGVEVAVLADGRLVASQLLPAARVAAPADLSRTFARQLADGFVNADDVQLYTWQLANGTGPELPTIGEANLAALAAGRLQAPPEFFESCEPSLLPAVGAALDAVRERTVPVNLLPQEGRGHDEGMSLTTMVLVALVGVLLLIWGGSALIKDSLLQRQLREEIVKRGPAVDRVNKLRDEIDDLRKQLDVLVPARERHITPLLAELSDLIPNDAYLTSLNVKTNKITFDGQARSAADLITALEKSKSFKGANFTSPQTPVGDNRVRFSIQAEIAK